MRFPKHLQDIHVDADDLARFAELLNAAGVKQSNGRRFTADAGETAMFARQLEYIRAKTYDKVYAENKALTFFPVSTDVPAGADTFTVQQWDWTGMAKIISNFADDLPTVSLIGRELPRKIHSAGIAYVYSIQEVRAAAFAGVPLNQKKVNAVRRAMENLVDLLASAGDADLDLEGATNNSNVPIVTPLHGDWDNAATTGQQIVEDLEELLWSVRTTSKDTFLADTILLATTLFKQASTRTYSAYDSRSPLVIFKERNPGVSVEQWLRLDTADAAGTGPRAMAYKKSDEVIEMVIPQPFEQLAPQQRNLAFVVPCHQRVGGVAVNYPIGMAYMDDLLVAA